jgi:hypothetical protein
MSPFETFSSVAFMLALFTGLRKFDKAEAERKSLAAKCAELDAQIQKSKADDIDTLNRVREYYDDQIKRQNSQIDGLSRIIKLHDKFIDMDSKIIGSLSDTIEVLEKNKK